tara:strand:+ start:118 stop:282 length:165 start_codon:yes stop_codon:yes gene_type:complete
MQTLHNMAQAHLGSVEKTISDLEQQKSAIELEISKLQEYLKQGLEVLNENTENN